MPKRKPRPKPMLVQGHTLAEVLAEVQRKGGEAQAFAQRTGLCPSCKKNPAGPNLSCSQCEATTNDLLKKLRGPCFFEFKIPID
jgi:hypothetical protein